MKILTYPYTIKFSNIIPNSCPEIMMIWKEWMQNFRTGYLDLLNCEIINDFTIEIDF